MLLVDARRLTGPSVLARVPLVVVELGLQPGETLEAFARGYRHELARMRGALGLALEIEPIVRAHAGGGVIAYPAPIDELLACAEMSEWAALSAIEVLAARSPLPLEPKRAEIASMLASERSENLIEIAAEAKRRDLPLLWDDDEVSIGSGSGSTCFPRAAVPAAESVQWEALARIPVALVTGTNGKTTSSRLLSRIASEAGFVVGTTSTDGITVGGVTIEHGDWTGPAAARSVLRRRDVQLAVLETARGGILRRGLAIETCDVALITNVSDDHLGGYGIDDLAAMTQVKGVIAHAVKDRGTVVLNAHDRNLVSLGQALERPVTYFADLERRDELAADVVSRHRGRGGSAVLARAGMIVCAYGQQETTLLRVEEVPITFGGRARYNVDNALGVVAAALALGLDREAIARGLRGFLIGDNPGRGQLLDRNGVSVMLDFGHNPEGVRAVMRLVTELRAGGEGGKLTVVTGSAGDRSDREIEDVARIVFEAAPDRVFVRELEHYLRGRSPGDVPELFRRAFARLGLAESAFAFATSEVDALARAFEQAEAGDFVVLLVHLDQDDVRRFLDAL